jgi:hypothetical protein
MMVTKRWRLIALILPSAIVFTAAMGLHRWLHPSPPSGRMTVPTPARPELQSAPGPKAVDYRAILTTAWSPTGSHLRPAIDMDALGRLSDRDAIRAVESLLAERLTKGYSYATEDELELAAQACGLLVDRYGDEGRRALLGVFEKTRGKLIRHIAARALLTTQPDDDEALRSIVAALRNEPDDIVLAWLDYILSQATGHPQASSDELATVGHLSQTRVADHWERFLADPSSPVPKAPDDQAASPALGPWETPAYYHYFKSVYNAHGTYRVDILDEQPLRRLPPSHALGVLYQILTNCCPDGGQHPMQRATNTCELALSRYGPAGRSCLFKAYKATPGGAVRWPIAAALLSQSPLDVEALQMILDSCLEEKDPFVADHLDWEFANLTGHPPCKPADYEGQTLWMTSQEFHDYWKPKIAGFLKGRGSSHDKITPR